MGFKAWFEKYAKLIGILSATTVFALTFVKDNVEDARRESDSIKTADGVLENGQKLAESFELRNEFSALAGKPMTTPAEAITRLGMGNRSNQQIWTELSPLIGLGQTIGRSLDVAKIQDLEKDCQTAQKDYEEILSQFHGDTSKLPTDRGVINKLDQLTTKVVKESAKLAQDQKTVAEEVHSHAQEALDDATNKMWLWKYLGQTLQIFGFVLTICALAFGGKPPKDGE